MGPELCAAYTQYLERMFQQSDELTSVDVDTVPDYVDWDRVSEWAVIE